MKKIDWKERAKRLKADVPAVFLTLKDRETPRLAKLFAGLTVAYALSPIDLVPDFIPVLGYLDDLLLLPLLVALTIRCIPREVWERNRREAEGLWESGKPVRWYFAVPILAVWAAVVCGIIRAVWH